MSDANRDQNFVPVALGQSSADATVTLPFKIDSSTGRLLVDTASGSGTVTSIAGGTGILLTPDPITTTGTVALSVALQPIATLTGNALKVLRVNAGETAVEYVTASAGTVTTLSVVSANGFAGSVANATTTPAITLTTTINAPALAGNGTAISAATTTGSGSTVVLATGPTFPTDITIGAAAGATGSILFKGTTSGTVTLKVADAAGTWSLTLPTTDGDSGQVLSTDGAGVTSWVSAGGVPTTITVANEATDTSCFIAFFTAATGDLGPKTNVNMTFDSSTGIATFASTVLTTTDINGGTIDNTVIGGATPAAGTFTLATAEGFAPTSTTATGNRMYLPAANTLGWAINGTGEMQLTATALSPISDGGLSFGTTALGWQNLFGNTGFVINIENGDWVATHTAGILTVGTGDLRVTTAGTNATSVVTVGGTQTLTSKTLTSPTLTTPSAFTTGGTITLAENTSIALDPAGSADGKYTGVTIAGTAGATLAFGDLVYLAVADSRWELADADAATTSDRMMGMCVLAAAADGDPTVLLLMGQIRADAAFPALTIGSAVYVGETAGDIQVAIPTGADNVIRRVGYALTADEIYFNPSMDSQITVA